MKITEQDIQLTFKEKFDDFFNQSPLSLVLLPIGIIILISIPFLTLFTWIYENTIEKIYYKLVGKKKYYGVPENLYKDLPIYIEYNSIWAIENCVQHLKEIYDYDAEKEEFGIVVYETNPEIADIKDKYFIGTSCVFENKLFLQEFKFPSQTISIGYIDCTNLTYHTIRDFDLYISRVSFSKTEKELEITLREYGMKKKIYITNLEKTT